MHRERQRSCHFPVSGTSAPPLPNRGLARTLHLWVVPRAEAIVWSVLLTRLSAVILPVGVKSSFGETRSSLVVMNPWLLGRTADASGTGDLQYYSH